MMRDARVATASIHAKPVVVHNAVRQREAFRMLSVEEALERILAEIERLEPENVALPEAAGRVLAEPISAKESIPPFANSAMDGYTLRSEDVQTASATHPSR